MFHFIALLLAVTALLSYVNYRHLGLHPSVGVMLIALLLSLGLIAAGEASSSIRNAARDFASRISFDRAVLQWMLGFLLFAGGLSVDLNELSRQRGLVALLSTVGTVASMILIALMIHPALRLLGLGLPLLYCLLLGALISPTDPVAVMSFLKNADAPRSIRTVIAAESLFNDGVGVVLFLTLLGLTADGSSLSWTAVGVDLLRQCVGGAALGLAGGWAVHRLLRRTFYFQLEVLLTLALVMGVYSLADLLRVSGPIAVVVAGLLIGNYGRAFNLSEKVNHDLHSFWELIEEILNAVLFVLIGLEVLLMPFTGRLVLAAALAIPIVLLARWCSVTGLVGLVSIGRRFDRGIVAILTWGGLRGGLAIAMALVIPRGVAHDRLVAITYGVVGFSILVQGTTLRPLIARLKEKSPEVAATASL